MKPITLLVALATLAAAQTYIGAGGCASSNCHGATTPQQETQSRILGNEFATWTVADHHALERARRKFAPG